MRRNGAVRGLGRMRNAAVQHCPRVAGALVDARGPEDDCPQTTDPTPLSGPVSPKNVQIGDKGLPTPRPHEREPWNHAVVFRPDESGPSLCLRFGHPQLLSGFCCGSRWRSMGAFPAEGARSTRSVRRAGGHKRSSRVNGNVAKTVDSSRRRARAALELLPRAGHALSVPGRVSPQDPPG